MKNLLAIAIMFILAVSISQAYTPAAGSAEVDVTVIVPLTIDPIEELYFDLGVVVVGDTKTNYYPVDNMGSAPFPLSASWTISGAAGYSVDVTYNGPFETGGGDATLVGGAWSVGGSAPSANPETASLDASGNLNVNYSWTGVLGVAAGDVQYDMDISVSYTNF